MGISVKPQIPSDPLDIGLLGTAAMAIVSDPKCLHDCVVQARPFLREKESAVALALPLCHSLLIWLLPELYARRLGGVFSWRPNAP